MIKKTIYITLISLLAILFWNCEKDDLCADGTPTTPQLIINFYDATNPSIKKIVPYLGIVEEGTKKDTLIFKGKDAIKLPLRTNLKKTTYHLISSDLDSNGKVVFSNINKIEFNYSTKDIYISRACGYKTLFTLANSPNGVVLTEIDNKGWINEVQVLQTNIINETETHIEIFF